MFTWVDWMVLAVYIAGTSWLADKLAGQKQTIRDYFLGGRSLPWYAVCGSIVASEISGVTFVSVPAIAFAKGGNYTYMMLAIGSILARVLVGYFVIPAYYRREIYSPYEFMGQRLGVGVHRATTALFFIGGFLAQGSRLFLAALVLDVITQMGIVWAILAIGGISVVWTWLGGINSVVWTDVVQFVILFVGGIVALVAVVLAVPGGAAEIVRVGAAADKFTLWNLSFDRTVEFTLWCGIFGSTALTLASHGTDQMMAQRLFCCRSEREARKAIVWSSVGLLLPVLMLSVGVGVYAYFLHNAPSPEQQARLAVRDDYALPFFILNAMPRGVKGLLFAAIFSAATATSTLAAMAQTALGVVEATLRKRGVTEAGLVRLSKVFVLLSAVGLCGVAIGCIGLQQFRDLLRLALYMAAYTYGAMLGILLLALLPFGRDARGLIWGVPFSILMVLAFSWQQVAWVRGAILGASLLLVAGALRTLWREPLRIAWVAGVAALVIAQTRLGYTLAFPWLYPIGAAITLGLGVALGRKRELTPVPAPVS